jgi:hypothetical protein
MTLRRLMGAGASALSRRRFLAGTGAAGWCAGCMPMGDHALCTAPRRAVPSSKPDGASVGGCKVAKDDSNDFEALGFEKFLPVFPSDWMNARFYVLHNARRYEQVSGAKPSAHVPSDRVIRVGRPNLVIGTLRTSDAPAQVQLLELCAIHSLQKFSAKQYSKPDDFFFVMDFISHEPTRGETSEFFKSIQIVQDLDPEQMLLTVGHEIFHRIQFQYCVTGDDPGCIDDFIGVHTNLVGFNKSFREGSARLMEHLLLPEQYRRRRPRSPWFSNETISLQSGKCFPPGSADRNFPYDSVLFWSYMAEQHGDDPDGVDVLKKVMDLAKANGGHVDVGVLRTARANMRGPGHFDQFLALGSTVADVAATDATWPNFLVALLLNGSPVTDSRFRLPDTTAEADGRRLALQVPQHRAIDYEGLPIWHEPFGKPDPDQPAELEIGRGPWTRARTHAGLKPMMTELAGLVGKHLAGDTPALPVMLRPYSFAAFHIFAPGDDAIRLLRVRTDSICGLGDAFVQIIMSARDGTLIDVVRAEARNFRRVLACTRAARITILVASRTQAGDFELGLSRIAHPVPLLFVTSWNCDSGRYLSVDPRQRRWTWQSPDLFRASGRSINCTIRNRGMAPARKVSRRISYKPWDQLDSDWVCDAWHDVSAVLTASDCGRRAAVFSLAESFPQPHLFGGVGETDLPCGMYSARPDHSIQQLHWALPQGAEPASAYSFRIEVRCDEDLNRVAVAHISPGGVPQRAPNGFRFT